MVDVTDVDGTRESPRGVALKTFPPDESPPLKLFNGGRDSLHERALYALFDGIKGDAKRMKEADALYERLNRRARLSAVSNDSVQTE
jgi:hypothetical protein